MTGATNRSSTFRSGDAGESTAIADDRKVDARRGAADHAQYAIAGTHHDPPVETGLQRLRARV